MLQATGKSLYSTIAQVTGAAYATVLGQIVSFLVALFAHMKWNKEIEKRKEYFKPSGDVIKSIYAIGVPAIYIMLAGFVILEVFATPFSALFDLSGETQSLCISAIRIISLSFVFAGCNIAFQGVFQALDSGVPSYIIWFTFLIAEGGSTIIALVFYKRVSSRRLP